MGKLIISIIGLVICLALNVLVAWLLSLLFKGHDTLQWFLMISTMGYYGGVFGNVYRGLSEEYSGE